MKHHETLPAGYRLCREIDFGGFSRENWIGVAVSAALLAVAVLIALPFREFGLFRDMDNSLRRFAYIAGLFVLLMLSVRLQEKLHGFLIYRFCGCPADYDNTMGIYPCANSGRYYVTGKGWTLSALLSVAVWAALLLAASLFVSPKWFWAPYLLFLVSLASAGGKIVAAALIAKCPPGTLVQDDAVRMRVYAPAETEEA